jgi:hypothetical protein
MTINNPELHLATLWDWACLDGCFGNTRIRPTDVDGMVERNGYFLFIETKKPGAKMPYGQELSYKNLVKRGRVTFFVIWGMPANPESIQVYTADGWLSPQACTLAELRDLVSVWFRKANAKGEIRLKDFRLRGAA